MVSQQPISLYISTTVLIPTRTLTSSKATLSRPVSGEKLFLNKEPQDKKPIDSYIKANEILKVLIINIMQTETKSSRTTQQLDSSPTNLKPYLKAPNRCCYKTMSLTFETRSSRSSRTKLQNDEYQGVAMTHA